MSYFLVEAKCGHVGKGKCIYICFPVKAESAKDAAAKARKYKRVKHHHKDAIRQVQKITYEEYLKLQMKNSGDGYLHCKNIQQQRELKDFEERVEVDYYLLNKQNRFMNKRDLVYIFRKHKIKEREAVCQIQEAVVGL